MKSKELYFSQFESLLNVFYAPETNCKINPAGRESISIVSLNAHCTGMPAASPDYFKSYCFIAFKLIITGVNVKIR
jgi:hypothetical protein